MPLFYAKKQLLFMLIFLLKKCFNCLKKSASTYMFKIFMLKTKILLKIYEPVLTLFIISLTFLSSFESFSIIFEISLIL